MPFFRPIRPLLRGWFLSVLGWGAVAALLGINQVLEGRGTAANAAHMALRDWLPWVVLTPLLFRLVMRFPLDRGQWKLTLPLHLAVCFLVLLGLHLWKERIGFGNPSPLSVAGSPGGPPDEDRPPRPPRPEGAPGWNAPPEDPGGFGPPRWNGVRPPPPPSEFDRRAGPGFHDPHHSGGIGNLFHFLTVDIPLYLMILSGAHTAFFFRREQERSTHLARARLETLRMQLQPHFLFNSLNTIAGLVHEDPDRADAMLTSLGEMLRLTLATSSQAELPLARELEFVECYLSIMHARFEDRLRVVLQIAPETREACLPGFLLQPLLENAVQHELEVNRPPGEVILRTWRELDRLHISLQDHGLPTPDALGLTTARERLQQLYGSAARVTSQSSGGCTIEISLPFHTTALA